VRDTRKSVEKGSALKKRMRDILLKCKGTHMEESF
jgi:hypothetical protein